MIERFGSGDRFDPVGNHGRCDVPKIIVSVGCRLGDVPNFINIGCAADAQPNPLGKIAQGDELIDK